MKEEILIIKPSIPTKKDQIKLEKIIEIHNCIEATPKMVTQTLK